MLDCLLEFALDLGGEILELLAGLGMEKHREKKKRREGREDFGREPWERKREKPPWEE